tara:strand:+ start:951 stop:1358 length:408 start_codon:yes stop_codon:yes gene_type:complete
MALIDDIKKHEGFSSVVYKCTAGYDTIGYGKRIKYLQVTEEQSTEWLEEDLENLKYTLSGKYDWFLPAPQEVRDIVMNMNYQLGVSAFSKFKKTIKYISDKDYQGASTEMLDSLWARVQTPRRAKELSDRMAKVE